MADEAARRPGPPPWFGPAVGFLVLTLPLGLLTVTGSDRLENDDTYFHLRFGAEFLSGDWSLRDPGSVSTFATSPWLPTQWLPQVAMAWTERHVGLWAVAVLALALALAYVSLLWVLVRRHVGAVLAAALVVLVTVSSAPYLSARPQVVSYLLTAWFTAAWAASARDGRPRWHLVALTWLWATCHGMWPVALVVGATAVVGVALTSRDRRTVARLGAVVAGCALAAALTPVGPRLYAAVVAVGGRSEFFAEWQATEFTTLGPALALCVLVPLLALLARRERADWPTIGLALLALGWALYSARTVPVALAMAVPLLAAEISRHRARASARPSRPELVAVGSLVVLALVAGGVLAHDRAAAPADTLAFADDELDALPPGSVVLDEWAVGGYVMWRHPGLDPVMHGYGDTFRVDELRRNADLLELEPGWRDSLDDIDPVVALLETDTPLAEVLTELLGWEVVDEGADHVLLAPPDAG